MEVFKINKENVRKQAIAIRNKLDKEQVINKSKWIIESLKKIEGVLNANKIFSYVSFGNEVDTHELIKQWISEGKLVCVPSVANAIGEDRCMHAVRISDFDELEKRGKYGILEPPLQKEKIIEPDNFDIVIVPGCLFDIHKNRMGYGAGFYDRFLCKVSKKCFKIGICYDFQVQEQILHESHDIALDLLVTENRIIT